LFGQQEDFFRIFFSLLKTKEKQEKETYYLYSQGDRLPRGTLDPPHPTSCQVIYGGWRKQSNYSRI